MHRKFLKWLLGVKVSTCNAAVYGEIGRYPLFITQQVRIIKYFIKLYTKKTENSILVTTMEKMRTLAENNVHLVNWASKVRHILQSAGFNNVWLYPSSVNVVEFSKLLRRRLFDLYLNKWSGDVAELSSSYLFKILEKEFSLADYLYKIDEFNTRKWISRLRLASHSLSIETGRHENIERRNRFCLLCDLYDIEDEFHFVLKCPIYNDLRKKYIPTYYITKPSMFKFISLLKCTKKKTIVNLSHFIKHAMSQRNTLKNLI